MDKVILYATPVFFLLISAELIWGVVRGRNTYRLADTITSLGQGILSQVCGVFTRVFRVALYTLVFEHVALWKLPEEALWVWLFGLLGYDFCYYWVHRSGHRVSAFWASHAVHHSSEDFNLGTALRQTSTGFWWTWIFYLPLAVLGLPPKVFAAVALIDLLYQFWVHTEHVGKLGWFDRVFVSPSNHRVHHGVNDAYVDKNYGGVLILWDRLFGTFQEERAAEPVVYGTRAALASWNPLIVSWRLYGEMIAASWRTTAWGDKLWCGPSHRAGVRPMQPRIRPLRSRPSSALKPAYRARCRLTRCCSFLAAWRWRRTSARFRPSWLFPHKPPMPDWWF